MVLWPGLRTKLLLGILKQRCYPPLTKVDTSLNTALLVMAPIHYSQKVISLFSAQSWGHCHSQNDLWSTVSGLVIQQIRSCHTAEMIGPNLARSREELLPSLSCRWQRKCTRLDDELLNSIDSAFWSGVDRNNHASQDEQAGWNKVCKEGNCEALQSYSVQRHSSQGLIHSSKCAT